MSHNAAVHVLLHRSPGHFDPTLLRVFTACHDRFEKIYREIVE
jgi:HD-GYP domain-containing protein (c-di-GMP phosphodiesterase class II)